MKRQKNHAQGILRLSPLSNKKRFVIPEETVRVWWRSEVHYWVRFKGTSINALVQPFKVLAVYEAIISEHVERKNGFAFSSKMNYLQW